MPPEKKDATDDTTPLSVPHVSHRSFLSPVPSQHIRITSDTYLVALNASLYDYPIFWCLVVCLGQVKSSEVKRLQIMQQDTFACYAACKCGLWKQDAAPDNTATLQPFFYFFYSCCEILIIFIKKISLGVFRPRQKYDRSEYFIPAKVE